MFGFGRHCLTAAEFREVMREDRLRFERWLAAYSAEGARRHEEVRAHQEKDRERLDEILAEGRAGREALFRILDRMDRNGGTAPAG